MNWIFRFLCEKLPGKSDKCLARQSTDTIGVTQRELGLDELQHRHDPVVGPETLPHRVDHLLGALPSRRWSTTTVAFLFKIARSNNGGAQDVAEHEKGGLLHVGVRQEFALRAGKDDIHS